MTAPTFSTEPSKFKAPTADGWRILAAADPADAKQQDEAKVARDCLKEALLTSLQMQHVVALAGSGASTAVGGPSMKDLWDAAIGIKPSEAAIGTAKRINYDLKLENIEEFLSKAEASLQVTELLPVSKTPS